jgi:hypothetical protein
MPYNPLANPYIINPLELPSNQVAAAMVPAWNIGNANQWCQSPSYTPNWGNQLPTPTPPVSPCASTSVTVPDATIADRDVAARAALNTELTRQTNLQTGATGSITAINNLLSGAPGVAAVSPNTGVHATAIAVTIQGSGFTGATAVQIGGVACTGVTVVDDGEITCTTGTTTVAGAGNVAVTTSKGTGTLTNGFTFT